MSCVYGPTERGSLGKILIFMINIPQLYAFKMLIDHTNTNLLKEIKPLQINISS
jgi:hypothetical protein